MKRTIYLLTLSAATLTGGCRQVPTTTIICLLDVSKSITPNGVRMEFNAAANLAGGMRRGDILIVIPITGNSINDTPGHILRLAAPVHREPYDADLFAFRKAATGDLKKMEDFYARHPAVGTDIIGALQLADEELESAAEGRRSSASGIMLYLLSDFVEDDGTRRFAGRPPASTDAAVELAEQLQREYRLDLPNATRVRLVELPSIDKEKVSPQDERSIRAFWLAYLAAVNPKWTAIDFLLDSPS